MIKPAAGAGAACASRNTGPAAAHTAQTARILPLQSHYLPRLLKPHRRLARPAGKRITKPGGHLLGRTDYRIGPYRRPRLGQIVCTQGRQQSRHCQQVVDNTSPHWLVRQYPTRRRPVKANVGRRPASVIQIIATRRPKGSFPLTSPDSSRASRRPQPLGLASRCAVRSRLNRASRAPSPAPA